MNEPLDDTHEMAIEARDELRRKFEQARNRAASWTLADSAPAVPGHRWQREVWKYSADSDDVVCARCGCGYRSARSLQVCEGDG